MADAQDEKMQLAVALNRVADRLDRLERMESPANSAQITVQAGGVGVWVAALCAAVCFVMVLVLGMLYIDHGRKIDDLGDYLTVIYTHAPHLKPENSDGVQKN